MNRILNNSNSPNSPNRPNNHMYIYICNDRLIIWRAWSTNGVNHPNNPDISHEYLYSFF